MIGTHPNVGFKFGRWLDTVMMQRALGEGADDAAGAVTSFRSAAIASEPGISRRRSGLNKPPDSLRAQAGAE